MKNIGQLKQWQYDQLRALLGPDLYGKLWEYEVELGDMLNLIKMKWDEAQSVYGNEGPRAFLEYFYEAQKQVESDPVRFNVCAYAIKNTNFENAMVYPSSARSMAISGNKPFKKKPKVLLLLSGRGNPEWVRKVDVRTVKKKAEELWGQYGAKRYHFKKRRQNMLYPQIFLNDIAEALREDGYDVKSSGTVRNRLIDARFELPSEAYLY